MKYLSTFFIALLSITHILCQSADNTYFSGMNVLGNGISVGAAIAIVASWSRNKSVLWAIIHGFLGWFYVVYYVITRGSNN